MQTAAFQGEERDAFQIERWLTGSGWLTIYRLQTGNDRSMVMFELYESISFGDCSQVFFNLLADVRKNLSITVHGL